MVFSLWFSLWFSHETPEFPRFAFQAQRHHFGVDLRQMLREVALLLLPPAAGTKGWQLGTQGAASAPLDAGEEGTLGRKPWTCSMMLHGAGIFSYIKTPYFLPSHVNIYAMEHLGIWVGNW